MDRPILFSGPMVLAIKKDIKMQTRMVVKPQPNSGPCGEMVPLGGISWGLLDGDLSGEWRCPYGEPGDLLWVRERWAVAECYNNLPPSQLILTQRQVEYSADDSNYLGKVRGRWRSSIHMPRWASRLTIEITRVRVERLQEISDEDAIAEGSQIPCSQLPKSCQQGCLTERTQFSRIWDSINGKKNPWESNPWVWAIEFKRL